MSNNYELIHPPYPMNFRQLNLKQAREYFDWFQIQLPIRIQVLGNYLHSFPNYNEWKVDFTPESLTSLGFWFFERVTTRLRTKEEIEFIYSNAPAWFRNFQIPEFDISTVAISISIDIAMYLSQVLDNNIDGLHWEIKTRPKKHINYHQPVLVCENKIEFNPVHIVLTYSYGIVRGTKGPERLKELYDIWSNILK